MCSSPKLIAAYRVLLRLLVPRHPSCALSSLTTKKQSLKNCLPVSQHKLLTFADIYISLNINFFLAEFSSRHFLQLSIIHSYSGSFSKTFHCIPLISQGKSLSSNMLPHDRIMVGVLGFEPRTSSLSGTRSNQLSYTPWWSRRGSNPRQPACKAGTLAN